MSCYFRFFHLRLFCLISFNFFFTAKPTKSIHCYHLFSTDGHLRSTRRYTMWIDFTIGFDRKLCLHDRPTPFVRSSSFMSHDKFIEKCRDFASFRRKIHLVSIQWLKCPFWWRLKFAATFFSKSFKSLEQNSSSFESLWLCSTQFSTKITIAYLRAFFSLLHRMAVAIAAGVCRIQQSYIDLVTEPGKSTTENETPITE